MSAQRIASMRARDEDRAATCAWLDAALADGQLDDAEHTARLALAYEARTLGDLDALVDDLQEPPGRTARRVRRVRLPDLRAAARPAAMAVGALIVGGGVGALLGSATAPRVPAPARWTEPAAIARFVDDYRATFGDTVVDEVRFLAAQVSVERPSADAPNRSLSYYYTGDFDAGGDVSRTDDVTADLGALDLTALAAIVAGAPTTTGLPGGAVRQVAVGSDPDGGVVRIHVSDESDRRGHIEIAFDGTVIAVYPYRP